MSKLVKVKTTGNCETNKDALRLIKRLGENAPDENVIEGISWNCNPYLDGKGIIEMYKYFKIKNDTRLKHFILFFDQTEICDISTAEKIATDICNFVSREYQTFFFIHKNQFRVHIHFVINNFKYDTGEPCEDTTEEFDKMLDIFGKVLKKHRISRFQYLSANKADNAVASEVTVIDVR